MKYSEINTDGTIKVNTPTPYIVTAYKDEHILKIADVAADLENSVKFLYDCMRVLGISKKKAVEMELTLNISTGDRLYDYARKSKTASKEIKMLIKTYNW